MADQRAPLVRSVLYVSTAFETWEARCPVRPDQDEICEEGGFRRLDPAYYAWLQSRMARAKERRDAGQLRGSAYAVLRERFNTIHAWAVEHFGEQALLAAVEAVAPRRYLPPGVGGPHEPEFAGVLDPPVGPFRFYVLVPRLARIRVAAIHERARALGWTEAQLHQTCGRYRFPCGGDYGLVCFVAGQRRIGEVTAASIEIVCETGSRLRFYRSDPAVRGRSDPQLLISGCMDGDSVV